MYTSDVLDIGSKKFQALIKAAKSLVYNKLKIITLDVNDFQNKIWLKNKFISL